MKTKNATALIPGAIGLTAGYLAKRLVFRKGKGAVKTALGLGFQYLVTRFVATRVSRMQASQSLQALAAGNKATTVTVRADRAHPKPKSKRTTH